MASPFKHDQYHVHNLARAGAPKRFAAPTIHPGMVGAPKSAKKLSAYHHGVTVEDEPLTTKFAHTGKSSPIHNGMGSENPEHRGMDFGPDHGSKILGSAGPASWRDEVGGKHGEFILDKSARLPDPPSGKRPVKR
jgi:hypothetical protein